MPIIVQQSSPGTPSDATTTTVQDIIDATSQDIRKVLDSTVAGDQTILIDYTDRIHKELLRATRWAFFRSSQQRIITEKGQTNYWIGATGTEPGGVVDTGLNLTDVDTIKRGTVFDRSNFRFLQHTDEPPLTSALALRDGRSRPGRPKQWRQDPDNKNIFNVYPAPDNQNDFQLTPNTPNVESVAGGALAARTYSVIITIVDDNNPAGESNGSVAASQFIPASSLVKVRTPVLPVTLLPGGVSYTSYRVYASTTVGNEELQATIALGTDWTEPTGGLVSGVSVPSTNDLARLLGYVIEFRYWPARKELTLVTDVLQIPDVYEDVVVSGVNWLSSLFLKREDDIRYWGPVYRDGIRQMIKDANTFKGEDSVIMPDPTTTYVVDSLGPLENTFRNFNF